MQAIMCLLDILYTKLMENNRQLSELFNSTCFLLLDSAKYAQIRKTLNAFPGSPFSQHDLWILHELRGLTP